MPFDKTGIMFLNFSDNCINRYLVRDMYMYIVFSGKIQYISKHSYSYFLIYLWEIHIFLKNASGQLKHIST